MYFFTSDGRSRRGEFILNKEHHNKYSNPPSSFFFVAVQTEMDDDEEDMTSTQVNRTAKRTVDAMDQAVLRRKVMI